MHLRIVAESYLTMTYVEKISGIYVIKGLSGELIKEAAKRMNFSYSVTKTADGTWGSPLSNGSWTGMTGMIIRNESDFSPGPFDVINERINIFDHSRELARFRYSILTVINPKSITRNDLLYIQAIDPFIWPLLIIFAIQFSLIVSFSHRFGFRNIVKNLFLGIEALLHGDFRFDYSSNAIITTLLYLYLLMAHLLRINITNSYNADLVVLDYRGGIDSLEDLANSKSIIPVIMKKSSLELYFEKGETKEQKLIWNKMLSNGEESFIINAIESLKFTKSMIEGKLAYIDSTIALKTLSASICNYNSKAEIYIARNAIRDSMVSFAFRRGFDKGFQEKFNTLISRLQEVGVLIHWFREESIENDKKLFANRSHNRECISRSWSKNERTVISNSFESLTVEGIRYAFISTLFGFIIASTVLSIELSVNRHNVLKQNIVQVIKTKTQQCST